MSLLNELAHFIYLTERISPKCKKSLLWKKTRDNMLRKAIKADLLTRGEFEEEEVDERLRLMDEEYERSIAGKDPHELLDEALGHPPRFKK